MSRTKKVILPELDIVDFNNKTQELIKQCQEEIVYKISDIDYKKNVQRMLINNHSMFKALEKQFIDYTLNMCGMIPLISSLAMYNKAISGYEFTPLNKDALVLFLQLKTFNFKVIFSLIRIIFQGIKNNGRNNSAFFRKVDESISSEPESWEDIERMGNNVLFYLLYLLVNTIDNVKIYISETDVLRQLDSVKNVYCIYQKKSNYTNDGIKNLYQQIIGTNEEISVENIEFIKNKSPKSEYEIYSYLLFDMRTKKTELDVYNIQSSNHCIFMKNFYSLFHQPTINFLSERKHNYIYNSLYTYLNTFNIFLNNNIKSKDRFRYLLAGSVIKSAYNVRDCADVDFFVLDHEDNIEKYSRFSPKTGIPGIYDDFGKTYYSNEEYYFPMIPEMYEKQKLTKRTEDTSEKQEKSIMNNYPKFSVSGLKAGRYIDIFSAECKKIGYDINNLDDLVFDPDFRVYFLGCPIVQLKIEMIRDNIKDIDLGRVSRKQLHDLHFLKNNYDYLFSSIDTQEFCLNRFRESKDRIQLNKISLGLNIYHKPLDSEDKIGYDLLIRRTPLYVDEMISAIIRDGPLLISRGNEIVNGDSRLVYQKPMLSSLPQSILTPSKRTVNVIYYYEISEEGEIKIYVNPEDELSHVSFYENICLCGNIKVDIKDGTKKLSLSVTGSKMDKIFSQIPGQEKKYKNLLINFMKSFIQIHKIIDCHTKEKINIDLLK